MTLPPTDPHKLVMEELRGEAADDSGSYQATSPGYDPAATPIAETPRIHTGWYGYAAGGIQLTITNFESSTVGGGDTGITASTGTGHMSQTKAGTALLNTWVTRDDVRDAGHNGENVPVKEAGFEIAKHAANVVNAIDPDPYGFGTIAADDVRFNVDADSFDETVYQYETTIRFTWSARNVS